MAYPIIRPNISLAWLSAIRHLCEHGGTAVNLFVAAEQGSEDPRIRRCLDIFLQEKRVKRKDVLPVQTVANTIFPASLYRVADSSEQLFTMHDKVRKVRERLKDKEEYFDRLVAWPASGQPVNQLREVIRRLKTVAHLSSAYELAVSVPEVLNEEEEQETFDLRIYAPKHDRRIMGFPCLSHISLTLKDSKLHLTALYRNQHFIRKAYGNYLGLAGLAAFLAEHAGVAVGELAIVATHADLELKTFSKKAVQGLIDECQSALSVDIEQASPAFAG